jgi:hypothetical protein
MDSKTFSLVSRDLDDLASEQLNVKGQEYPTNDDRLSNFKSTADIANQLVGDVPVRITPAVVGLIFALKHFIPILKYANGENIKSEDPMGKAADLVNYVKLLYAMGYEQDTNIHGIQEALEELDTKYVGVPGYIAPEALTPDGHCIVCNLEPHLCKCRVPEG